MHCPFQNKLLLGHTGVDALLGGVGDLADERRSPVGQILDGVARQRNVDLQALRHERRGDQLHLRSFNTEQHEVGGGLSTETDAVHNSSDIKQSKSRSRGAPWGPQRPTARTSSRRTTRRWRVFL